jgi:hypothetical protein
MFTPDDVFQRVQRRPFVPLRIVTSAGEQFDIYHPDLVLVGERDITVGTASTQNPRDYSTVSWLAIVHITALVDLPAVARPQANGEP